ncbi:MAG: hypothetical protein F2839_02595 [Actinobacteria bacterium]|uniref:Unannotated protein n=1 Tax=freshwater metagenome TaxID=449393 RepID=A0A6J5YX77_9ZZZZ|nr:hypothetical protein [Actinomycetota bacterium]
MLFGIGLPELLVLAMVGLIVFGPERLPDMAAKLANGVKGLRNMARRAMADFNVEGSAVTKTLSDLQSLTPRAVVGDIVSSVVADQKPVRANSPTAQNSSASNSVQAHAPLVAAFDPDAT